MSKHLTDAECAAHYWQMRAERSFVRDPLPDVDELDETRYQRRKRLMAWTRFATHPHAHDED